MIFSYSGCSEEASELLFGACKNQRSLIIQEYTIFKFFTSPLSEMVLKFSDDNDFIENGLTPAAFIGKKISFTLENESQLQSVLLLKRACPYYKHTHKIVVGNECNPKKIYRVLAEIMKILKPREIEIQCKRGDSFIDKPANFLFVHKLTVC